MGINALVADGDAESFGDTSKTVQDGQRKTDSSRQIVQPKPTTQIVAEPTIGQHPHLYTCTHERSTRPRQSLAS